MDFCTCSRGAAEPFPLAMAAVPMQQWEAIYDPKTSITQGTVFPSLDLPFYVTEENKGGGLHG